MAVYRFFLFSLLLAALVLPGRMLAQTTPGSARTDSAVLKRAAAIRAFLHAHSADSVAIRARAAALRDSLRTHGVDSVTSRAKISAFWNGLLYGDGQAIRDIRAARTAGGPQGAPNAGGIQGSTQSVGGIQGTPGASGVPGSPNGHVVDSAAIRARMTAIRDSLRIHGADSAAYGRLNAGVDSLARRRDSLGRDSARIAAGAAGTGGAAGKSGKPPGPAPDTRGGIPKISISQDLLFYVLLAMLLWMGILKSGYEKYYSDLFTVFFRSSLRQHQIREQLLQARLPSLLYNLFFVGCAGTFLYLIAAQHAIRVGTYSPWELWLASVGIVALLYVAKFLGLKLSGWIFGMSGAVDTYIFIVFLVNKILGVALLPIVILLAFSKEPIQSAAATLGILLVAGMLIYRFIRSYRPVWEEVQMSRFHFFLYLCTFEIAPLLLIYKSMLKLL